MLQELTDTIEKFVRGTYALNDKLAKPFEPMANIAYKPVEITSEWMGIPSNIALLFVCI